METFHRPGLGDNPALPLKPSLVEWKLGDRHGLAEPLRPPLKPSLVEWKPFDAIAKKRRNG